MDDIDRAVINRLQDGIPVVERPFLPVAEELGLEEDELVQRVRHLREDGVLTRFGPLFHAERLGGSLVLAAMRVPPEDFGRVAEQVNALPEVAHNYQRDHAFNMWFVLATETPEGVERAIAAIEAGTGLKVYPMPKLAEYFIGLRFQA